MREVGEANKVQHEGPFDARMLCSILTVPRHVVP